MKLKSILINRGYASAADAPLRGEARLADANGTELKIALDEELSKAVVQLCAEAIARAGTEAAKALTSDAIASTAIEHKPND